MAKRVWLRRFHILHHLDSPETHSLTEEGPGVHEEGREVSQRRLRSPLRHGGISHRVRTPQEGPTGTTALPAPWRRLRKEFRDLPGSGASYSVAEVRACHIRAPKHEEDTARVSHLLGMTLQTAGRHKPFVTEGSLGVPKMVQPSSPRFALSPPILAVLSVSLRPEHAAELNNGLERVTRLFFKLRYHSHRTEFTASSTLRCTVRRR